MSATSFQKLLDQCLVIQARLEYLLSIPEANDQEIAKLEMQLDRAQDQVAFARRMFTHPVGAS